MASWGLCPVCKPLCPGCAPRLCPSRQAVVVSFCYAAAGLPYFTPTEANILVLIAPAPEGRILKANSQTFSGVTPRTPFAGGRYPIPHPRATPHCWDPDHCAHLEVIVPHLRPSKNELLAPPPLGRPAMLTD